MTIHIATTRNIVHAVHRGMRVPVRTINDGWLIGPCSLDPEVHIRLRNDFWAHVPRQRAALTTSFRRIFAALAGDEPVVLWTSVQWNDRIALWALCFYRIQRRPTQPDFSLILMGKYEERHALLSFGIVYVTVDPAMARDAWRTARPLSLREIRVKARCWQKLAAPSPILSGKPLRETRANEELLELGTYQAGLFPKQTARGLGLSTLDALLLACVNETPSSPVDILACDDEAGEELWRWVSVTGDIAIFDRLAQWAKVGALHATPYTAPNGWKTAKYTLTATGRALLRDGLSSLDQAPPFPIWGVTAYDPKNPWVVVEESPGKPWLRRPS